VRSVIGGRYHPGDFQLLNLAYRFQRYPSDTIDANEQVDLSWQWPMAALWGGHQGKSGQRSDSSGRYYSVGRLAYSLRESRLVDTLLGVEYDAGCWISRLVLVRSQINQDTANTSLMFQLEFVGFTRIGIDPLKTLTSSISRYQNLRDSKASNSGLNNDNGSP
jgi:LPS-assembly protein